MQTIKTKGHNVWFNAPDGWEPEKDGTCGALSVRREAFGRNVNHVSTWRPTADEWLLLSQGGVIELSCVGIQPPVALRVIPKPENSE